MNSLRLYFFVACISLLYGCGGGGGGSPDNQANTPPNNNPQGSGLAPSNLSVAAGDKQNTLTWDKVTDAASYNLYFSTVSNTAREGQVITSIPTNSYVHTGLTNSVTYYYLVTAVRSDGTETTFLQEVAATPTAPSNTGGNGSLVAGRYQVQGSIVRDVMTNLEWMRCSLGQSLDGNTCSPRFPPWYKWDDIAAELQNLNSNGGFEGHSDWRLPTLEELRGLVYCSSGQPEYWPNSSSPCSGDYLKPTIVHEAFPSDLNYSYWTSTPSPSGSIQAYWTVVFLNGAELLETPNTQNKLVRPVRSGN